MRIALFVLSLMFAVILAACSVARQDVLLDPPEGSTAPAEVLFSVSLPDGWEVTSPQAGGDSWSGAFSGDDVTIEFLGGPFAVSDIYRTLAGGGDSLMQSKHINFSGEINGHQATIVRSRKEVADGLTGMVIDFPTRRGRCFHWIYTGRIAAFCIVKNCSRPDVALTSMRATAAR